MDPGRVTGWMCACGVKLAGKARQARCAACGRRYRLTADGLVAADAARSATDQRV